MTRPPAMPQRNATEVLEQQLQLLNSINQMQAKQLALLEQNRTAPGDSSGTGYVKIIDFNMPFFAMVGMFIKMSLAAIPAALVLTVIWSILFGILFFGLSVLGIGLGALSR